MQRMTHRERLLAACRGEPVDALPWAPRLELWHRANSLAGTLPAAVAGLTVDAIEAKLGLPRYAVVPDFQDLRSPEDEVDRCLGIWRLPAFVHQTDLVGVDREVVRDSGQTKVTYRTPVGSVSCAFEYSEEMKRGGVTIPWVREHLLTSVDDVTPLAYIYSHADVRLNEERFARWRSEIGEKGLAVGFALGFGSPMHLVLHDLATVETAFLLLHDHPDEMARLVEAIGVWLERVLAVSARSSADVVFWGGNYDAAITYPPFFLRHIAPWLARTAAVLHDHGKLLLTHADGENTGLTRYYQECGVDVADAVCPAPMTRLPLRQIAEDIPDVTIWGGIPSIALLPEAMPDEPFERLLDDTFALARGRHRFIVGVADAVPPGASWERLCRISERAAG